MKEERRTSPGLTNLWHAYPKRHAALTSVPIFQFFCPISVSLCTMCVCVCVCVCMCMYVCMYVHTSDCVETIYELPLLPDNTAMKHFYTNRSGAKCWLDIYRWGAGLAVTGPIRDIGQNVLHSSFEQEAVAAALILPHFVPYRIPRGDLCLEIWYNNYNIN